MLSILMANVLLRPQNSNGKYFGGFLPSFHLIFTFKYFLDSEETKSKSEKLTMELKKKKNLEKKIQKERIHIPYSSLQRNNWLVCF